MGEFKKLVRSYGFLKLTKDKFCYEIVNLIFPQFKNLSIFKNLNNYAKEKINNLDFIFLISLMIVDGTDNVDYFVYKFNLSKKDQKRILFLNNFLKKNNNKTFSKKNLQKILYFNDNRYSVDRITTYRFVPRSAIHNQENDNKIIKPILPIKSTIIELIS